jgi:predicted amidohydrolase YtcJ
LCWSREVSKGWSAQTGVVEHPYPEGGQLRRSMRLMGADARSLTSAYAEFQEKEKGTIEPGKLADIAVWSQDIFTVPAPELPKTVSVLTLVGGRVVYRATAPKIK